MSPYEVKIGGATLTVRPQEDGTYLIYRNNLKLAQLVNKVSEHGTIWETTDWIDDEYARQIGAAIEEYEEVPSIYSNILR